MIVRDVRELARDHDLVFTTGGVGPTHDDVTIAAIAQAFDRPLVRHPLLEGDIRRHYGEAIASAPQLRMADVPEGSRLVGKGDIGFPVVALENVFIFPGIPESVRRKFGRIREEFREARCILRRIFLRCDEGEIAAELYRALDRFPRCSSAPTHPPPARPPRRSDPGIQAARRGGPGGQVPRGTPASLDRRPRRIGAAGTASRRRQAVALRSTHPPR